MNRNDDHALSALLFFILGLALGIWLGFAIQESVQPVEAKSAIIL